MVIDDNKLSIEDCDNLLNAIANGELEVIRPQTIKQWPECKYLLPCGWCDKHDKACTQVGV